MSDEERAELAQEHADLMEMAAEYQYRAEEHLYSACFEPDDPQQEEEYADAGLDYQTFTTARGRTEELQRTLKRRLRDQPMGMFGDRVRQAVMECRTGALCGFPTCATCGLKQRDEMAWELIPVVKAWKTQFGDDRVSFVSVDGEVCTAPEVVKTMNRFRRRFENTFQNNLRGTVVRGEFELALTWKSELQSKKPKPVKINKPRRRGRFHNMIYSVETKYGEALVYRRDIHKGRKNPGWFIRDSKGNRIDIVHGKPAYANFDGKGRVSSFLDHGVKYVASSNADSTSDLENVGGSNCVYNPLPPDESRLKVHAHVVILHRGMDRDRLREILNRTFKTKGAVCVTGIEDRTDRRGNLKDGVVQVSKYIFDKSSAVKGAKRREYRGKTNPGGIDASLQALAFDGYATLYKGTRRRMKIHYVNLDLAKPKDI